MKKIKLKNYSNFVLYIINIFVLSIAMQVDRWPSNGYVKKLKRRDGSFYYFNKGRECSDSDVHRTKIYAY